MPRLFQVKIVYWLDFEEGTIPAGMLWSGVGKERMAFPAEPGWVALSWVGGWVDALVEMAVGRFSTNVAVAG
jgi:hypothetical protein